ncbi:MAG: UbiA-like polyprenyltransferase [Peptococcaceae bacterium]|nr:putative 4-hydroxybenzoate polyprenyltransferase [Peptococcaceae bacterium]MDH7524387.1 UbiA-like polyprenyltransferase [Peptococcaceae bacterium]
MILKKIKLLGELIKYEHTVFALPFAYLGAILAQKAFPSWWQLFWITLAMAAARSAAMGLNRVIDRHLDAANPRTAGRHLPRGLVSVLEVKVFIAFSLVVFVYCVYVLSPRHLVYTPVIMLFLVGYSYTKRFTWLSHLILGATDGFAPLGGWIAVTRSMDPTAFLLGAVVAFWVAGFDIIYATLDLDFDREYGLYSLPLNFGLKNALLISRALHALSVLLLLFIFFFLGLGWWFLAGIAVMAVLLVYEHSIISPNDLSRVNTAFFNVNGLISILLLAFTAIDVLF